MTGGGKTQFFHATVGWGSNLVLRGFTEEGKDLENGEIGFT